jgi:hypothetical protein
MSISLEDLRKVLGLESIKDAEGNVVREAPLPVWANFQQRALDVAILEINTKTDLKIKLAFDRTLKASPGSRAEVHDQDSSGTERPPFGVRPKYRHGLSPFSDKMVGETCPRSSELGLRVKSNEHYLCVYSPPFKCSGSLRLV